MDGCAFCGNSSGESTTPEVENPTPGEPEVEHPTPDAFWINPPKPPPKKSLGELVDDRFTTIEERVARLEKLLREIGSKRPSARRPPSLRQ